MVTKEQLAGGLIAAAPELLAACKELVAWADRYGHCDVSWPGHLAQVIKLAEAAIAKAEGGGK